MRSPLQNTTLAEEKWEMRNWVHRVGIPRREDTPVCWHWLQ
jgi:hypothetical protein